MSPKKESKTKETIPERNVLSKMAIMGTILVLAIAVIYLFISGK